MFFSLFYSVKLRFFVSLQRYIYLTIAKYTKSQKKLTHRILFGVVFLVEPKLLFESEMGNLMWRSVKLFLI